MEAIPGPERNNGKINLPFNEPTSIPVDPKLDLLRMKARNGELTAAEIKERAQRARDIIAEGSD